MKSLTALITELESKLPFIEQKNEAVSKASVGWHLEHSLLALIKMISAVEHSNPADYKRKFNIKLAVVLLLNKFPRGRANVPDSVKPGDVINKDTIAPLLSKAKQKAASFEKLSRNKFFTHPFFGDLRLKQARKIIAIHTNHHIKIINDILRK